MLMKRLWRVHQGCHLRGLAEGDDIAIQLGCLPDDEADKLCQLGGGTVKQRLLPNDVTDAFKPYTCEVEASNWHVKRQSAKNKGRAKVKRSGKGTSPADRKYEV